MAVVIKIPFLLQHFNIPPAWKTINYVHISSNCCFLFINACTKGYLILSLKVLFNITYISESASHSMCICVTSHLLSSTMWKSRVEIH